MGERTNFVRKTFLAGFILILFFLLLPLQSRILAQSAYDPKSDAPRVIHAFKKLDDRLSSLPFTFELKNQNGEVLLTAENNRQGLVTFDLTEIDYLRWFTGDVYKFTLSEVIPEGDDSYIWDDSVFDIAVHVYEDPYVNFIECYRRGSDTKLDEIIFDNRTNEPPEEPTPVVLYPLLPETGFSAAAARQLPMRPDNIAYKSLKYTLQIPRLGLAASLVNVPLDSKSGRYDVTWLGSDVGVLEGFSLPGEGHALLTGHNHLNTTDPGPFVDLLDLAEGDRIFLNDPEGKLSVWIVYANEKIAADDWGRLEQIASASELSLTFITCEDELVEGGYANRRIVAAKPAD